MAEEKIKVLYESSNLTEHNACIERIVEYKGQRYRYFYAISRNSNSLAGWGKKTEGGISILSPTNGWVQIEDYETLNLSQFVGNIRNNELYRFNEQKIYNLLTESFETFDMYILDVF